LPFPRRSAWGRLAARESTAPAGFPNKKAFQDWLLWKAFQFLNGSLSQGSFNLSAIIRIIAMSIVLLIMFLPLSYYSTHVKHRFRKTGKEEYRIQDTVSAWAFE
jgi:hypothetical protein